MLCIISLYSIPVLFNQIVCGAALSKKGTGKNDGQSILASNVRDIISQKVPCLRPNHHAEGRSDLSCLPEAGKFGERTALPKMRKTIVFGGGRVL